VPFTGIISPQAHFNALDAGRADCEAAEMSPSCLLRGMLHFTQDTLQRMGRVAPLLPGGGLSLKTPLVVCDAIKNYYLRFPFELSHRQ